MGQSSPGGPPQEEKIAASAVGCRYVWCVGGIGKIISSERGGHWSHGPCLVETTRAPSGGKQTSATASDVSPPVRLHSRGGRKGSVRPSEARARNEGISRRSELAAGSQLTHAAKSTDAHTHTHGPLIRRDSLAAPAAAGQQASAGSVGALH